MEAQLSSEIDGKRKAGTADAQRLHSHLPADTCALGCPGRRHDEDAGDRRWLGHCGTAGQTSRHKRSCLGTATGLRRGRRLRNKSCRERPVHGNLTSCVRQERQEDGALAGSALRGSGRWWGRPQLSVVATRLAEIMGPGWRRRCFARSASA